MTSDIDAIFVVERAAASIKKFQLKDTQQKFNFDLIKIRFCSLTEINTDFVIRFQKNVYAFIRT